MDFNKNTRTPEAVIRPCMNAEFFHSLSVVFEERNISKFQLRMDQAFITCEKSESNDSVSTLELPTESCRKKNSCDC